MLSFVKQFKGISVICKMKKVFSISVTLLILVTMLHFSIAIHYCQGKEFASKLSLTGKLASCGMEDNEKALPGTGTNFTNKCCDDVVTYFGRDNNFVPSYSFIPEFFQSSFQSFALPLEFSADYSAYSIHTYTNESPPGALMSTNVDITDICVFRI
jgi:hypothetical protein